MGRIYFAAICLTALVVTCVGFNRVAENCGQAPPAASDTAGRDVLPAHRLPAHRLPAQSPPTPAASLRGAIDPESSFRRETPFLAADGRMQWTLGWTDTGGVLLNERRERQAEAIVEGYSVCLFDGAGRPANVLAGGPPRVAYCDSLGREIWVLSVEGRVWRLADAEGGLQATIEPIDDVTWDVRDAEGTVVSQVRRSAEGLTLVDSRGDTKLTAAGHVSPLAFACLGLQPLEWSLRAALLIRLTWH